MQNAASRLALMSRGRSGVALIIILAFVVLLTGLIIAFFSRSILDRQISNSSASEAKVTAFANGAANAIIGELKQEIVLTSNAVPLSSGTIYVPLTPWGMMPQITGTNGVPVSGTLAANILKISGSGQLFYSGANGTIPSSGNSNVTLVSSTVPSLNGRYVTPARWNEHYLLPLLSPSTDSTPDPNTFIPPSWLLVARDGSDPTPTSLMPYMTASGTDPVVGRYAFAVYHEGGLLDMNAVGYPSTSATTGEVAYKPALAYADLTQIPGLSGTAVDALIAWRNDATTQQALNSSYLTPNFSAQTATNYYGYVVSNTTGFLSVSGSYNTQIQTDRMFTSRQQLIQFVQNGLGLSGTYLDCLNYLTHFSRALEQPSYVPSPGRPSIVGNSGPPTPVSTQTYEGSNSGYQGYQGNNAYWGGESAINMTGSGGILSVRVLGPFTRSDGSMAVIGEPLVKRKFALSRLQLVTTAATATASGTNPIYAYFGLARASGTSSWIYNHGSTGGIIMTLSQVAAAGREPDFAELLKAAINVGSVGKGGPGGPTDDQDYEYANDVSGDVQILQIMANLIDQQKPDNYPTRIQFSDANNVLHSVYGDQNLPYFYRWHYFSVTTKVPSPLLSSANVVPALSGTVPVGLNHAMQESRGTTLQSGSAAYLIIPEVWNPHDANTTQLGNTAGPTNFRVVAVTNDPSGTLGTWGIYAVPGNGYPPTFDNGGAGVPAGYTAANPPSTTWSSPAFLSATNSNSWVQFADTTGSGLAFREPTLLWRNVNNAISLSGNSFPEDTAITGAATPVTYYGILVGRTPISWVAPIATASGTVNCILQTSSMSLGTPNGVVTNSTGPPGSFDDDITFLMQYQDASGNWITYESTYCEDNLKDIGSYALFVNPADYTTAQNQFAFDNPLMPGIAGSNPFTHAMGGLYDPRTPRFAAPVTGHSFDDDDTILNGNPTLDAVTMISGSNLTPAGNQQVPPTYFVLMKTQRPATSVGQYYEYTTPCLGFTQQMHWYSSQSWTGTIRNGFDHNGTDANFYEGLLSQNNPSVQIIARDGVTVQQEYYEDPDGVPRRAMGAYVPTNGSIGKPSNTRDTNMQPTATSGTATIGLPLFTSGPVAPGSGKASSGYVLPSFQSQSRPIILHRPFRSVAEMSYAFRGTPWKNIDFFTPESGDTALLDTFCVNEPPTNPLVAGKVNLNTSQTPVIQAILNGAYRDELNTTSDALPPLSTVESYNIAKLLVGITGSKLSWRGPLTNVGDLVGHYVANATGPFSGADYYQYPIHDPISGSLTGGTNTYAGFSAALSGTTPDGSDVWDTPSNNPAIPTYGNISSRNIQRFRESAIRPLAECGQTRVWNLLIDVIAQTGRYPTGATNLAGGFLVEGEKRYWIHIAIDRITGQIIDRQIESVPE